MNRRSHNPGRVIVVGNDFHVENSMGETAFSRMAEKGLLGNQELLRERTALFIVLQHRQILSGLRKSPMEEFLQNQLANFQVISYEGNTFRVFKDGQLNDFELKLRQNDLIVTPPISYSTRQTRESLGSALMHALHHPSNNVPDEFDLHRCKRDRDHTIVGCDDLAKDLKSYDVEWALKRSIHKTVEDFDALFERRIGGGRGQQGGRGGQRRRIESVPEQHREVTVYQGTTCGQFEQLIGGREFLRGTPLWEHVDTLFQCPNAALYARLGRCNWGWNLRSLPGLLEGFGISINVSREEGPERRGGGGGRQQKRRRQRGGNRFPYADKASNYGPYARVKTPDDGVDDAGVPNWLQQAGDVTIFGSVLNSPKLRALAEGGYFANVQHITVLISKEEKDQINAIEIFNQFRTYLGRNVAIQIVTCGPGGLDVGKDGSDHRTLELHDGAVVFLPGKMAERSRILPEEQFGLTECATLSRDGAQEEQEKNDYLLAVYQKGNRTTEHRLFLPVLLRGERQHLFGSEAKPDLDVGKEEGRKKPTKVYSGYRPFGTDQVKKRVEHRW